MPLHRRPFAAALALSVAAPLFLSAALAADTVPSYVTAAVGDTSRPNWDLPRDAARKPADILAFAQIKPGMAVVDLVPGEGYYTRILSKLVGPKGKVFGMVSGAGGNNARAAHMAMRAGQAPAIQLKDDTACGVGCYPDKPRPYIVPIEYILALQNVREFNNITAMGESLASNGGEFPLPVQGDAVLSVNGYHQLHSKTDDISDMVAVNKAMFRALKSGAVVTIADASGAKGSGFTGAETLGRVEPDAVKAEMLAAGFVLDGESSLLSNAGDDHTKAADETSDRFVLRFKKPANAPSSDKRPKNPDAILGNYYGNTYVTGYGATGNVTGQRQRNIYIYKDGTYQEFGKLDSGPGPTQNGYLFWNADGVVCMMHEYPTDERGMVVCQASIVPREVGKIEDRNMGGRTSKVGLLAGHIPLH